MKTIKIKSLILTNFKGIKSLYIKDFQHETNVFGANGTGKTSIIDAFIWLLFGKDSSDRSNFEIKTLDAQNNPIPKIDHSVEAIIDVNGEETSLKRTFREIWRKKRGALEAEFSGNETLYEWNGVPMNAKEYTSKLGFIIDEKIFKLITNPAAFNSLKWQDQRQVLIDISGGVTDTEIAQGNRDFETLLTKLTNKTLEEYLKQIKASIRKSKSEIKAIPTRIDEVERSKPDQLDFESIEAELKKHTEDLKNIEDEITHKSKIHKEIQDKRLENQKQIYVLEADIEIITEELKQKAKKQFLKNSSESKIKELKEALRNKTGLINSSRIGLQTLDSKIESKSNEINLLNDNNKALREKWETINASEFKMDESTKACPTCNREFEESKLEILKNEAKARFTKNKEVELEDITRLGSINNNTIHSLEREIEELEQLKVDAKDQIKNLETEQNQIREELETLEKTPKQKEETKIFEEILKANNEIPDKKNKVADLKEKLSKEPPITYDNLKEERSRISELIDACKDRLSAKKQIQIANERKDQLSKEEQVLAQTISDYEREQHTIDSFIKAKIDTLEAVINNRFEVVNFKLFEMQVNGVLVPTCKALINGVPFNDANTASKINAGLDIINTLCKHHKVHAPIFIDNRESVTNIIPTENQIINLIVDPSKKSLEVK